ncbi:hypothetical protein BKA81DRAFT_169524 [Phyllosticta paracitricarpa]|uniref:Secreted protein n=1 Tax=Phyllosticta citricarpa TaxID=55181 RepID=A0ABR1MMJ4_9PEZI
MYIHMYVFTTMTFGSLLRMRHWHSWNSCLSLFMNLGHESCSAAPMEHQTPLPSTLQACRRLFFQRYVTVVYMSPPAAYHCFTLPCLHAALPGIALFRPLCNSTWALVIDLTSFIVCTWRVETVPTWRRLSSDEPDVQRQPPAEARSSRIVYSGWRGSKVGSAFTLICTLPSLQKPLPS